MLKRTSRSLLVVVLLAGLLAAGSAGVGASSGAAAGPPDGNGLDRAIAVQNAHTEELLKIQGVVGTGMGLGADGQPVIVIYTESAGVAGLPSSLDGVPVEPRVTGRFFAFAPPPLDANFTSSCSGLDCAFDASSTTGRGQKSYSWDFDKSDGIGTDATAEKVSHTYGASGTYTVTLTASNDKGETDTQEHDVTVSSGGGGDTDCTATGDTTVRCERPVPIGVSTGHPDITAGTIGARITDGTDVFALSNNHIYANQNDANIGDPALQPGPFDGGTEGPDPNVIDGDEIGILHDFEPLKFDGSDNTMDAAIALSSTTDLGNSTPSDGYGTPSSTPVSATLELAVQKYGRTTSLTTGTVSEINVTVNVCYEGFVVCTKLAKFVDQIAITPGSFSDGGDSGSLIVTNDVNKNPVGLLFAGSSTRTIANRIDLVLNRFNVTVDGETPAPPPADTTPPALVSATVDSSSVVLAYDEQLDPNSVPATGDFSIGTDGDAQSVTAVGVSGTDLMLTLSPGVASGDAVTVSYTARANPIQDTAGNDAANLVDQPATNDTAPPAEGVSVTGITPDTVQNCSCSYNVTVSGSGFAAGADLTFENSSGPTPTASNVQVVDVDNDGVLDITATVTLKSGGPPRNRVWDVRVTNSDGSSGVLVDGFTVTP